MQNPRRLVPVVVCLIAAAALVAAAPAQAPVKNPYAPDKVEPGSVEAIAKFTTDPRFGNPWVAYLPDSGTVPSPMDYLGRVVGAAGELSSVSQIYGYFRKLAETSPRVRLQTIGKSEEGRDILLAVIADEAGIRDLDRLKAATAALADPRKTTPDEAEALIAAARPVYYFNAGLHSTELGSPEMVMEMAYRLAVSDQPMIKRIRESVLVLINPVSEPDGRDKQVDWFYRYLKGKTDYESLPPDSPPYWGHYVFHDNNRDAHQMALQSSKAVAGMFFEYHPTVVHDLHESIPLLQTWNGTGPFNRNLDPILLSEWFSMSLAEVGALTAAGMPGVWTWGFSDGWQHVFLDSIGVNHNSIGRGYETFGNGTAETVERVLRAEEERYVGRPVTSQEWYRPMPPPRKFLWSLRNNTNYMESGCLAALDYAAKNAREMLRDFYRKSHNSWQKGVKGKPCAFVIPAEQGDRKRVSEMVELLLAQGIEVGRATAAFKVAEGEYPDGTYVVRLDQPYRNYAVDLLTPQVFPPDAQYEPYDDVSWSLPVHFGVEAKAVDDAGIKDVRLAPLEPGRLQVPPGKGLGAGPVYLLKDTGQESLLALRARLASFRVEIAEKAFKAGDRDYPAGSWILPAQKGLDKALAGPVRDEFHLDLDDAPAVPDVPRHESKLPRVAVWHLWTDTQAVGWIRLVLDREKVPYAYIRDEDIRAGRLREKYDVIIFGDNWSNVQGQILGIEKKWAPLAYTKTAETPNLGVPDASADITGGIGWGGLARLEEFLGAGGVLVTLGNGSALPLEGGLVRGVRRRGGSFFTPGSELRAKFVKPGHPLAYGSPEVTSVFRSEYPVYDLARSDRGGVLMQWGTKLRKEDREEDPEKDAALTKEEREAKEKARKDEVKMLISGALKGEDDLEGRPAVMEFAVGKGRVVAFNFNPIHRDLNRSDHRLLWNVLLNWNALGVRPQEVK